MDKKKLATVKKLLAEGRVYFPRELWPENKHHSDILFAIHLAYHAGYNDGKESEICNIDK